MSSWDIANTGSIPTQIIDKFCPQSLSGHLSGFIPNNNLPTAVTTKSKKPVIQNIYGTLFSLPEKIIKINNNNNNSINYKKMRKCHLSIEIY